ncbi:MAG: hypothetical protein EOO15_12935, partial [Chitinophagaceae bacterium]
MESSDDEGDPAAAQTGAPIAFAGRAALLLSFLLFCYQPQSRTRSVVMLPPSKAAPPPVAKARPPKAKKARKKLYLTFDDGPNKGTRNVWTIVRDEGVPVSFFLVGEHVFDSKGQQALFDSLRNVPFIELCNHSYSHAHSR